MQCDGQFSQDELKMSDQIYGSSLGLVVLAQEERRETSADGDAVHHPNLTSKETLFP